MLQDDLNTAPDHSTVQSVVVTELAALEGFEIGEYVTQTFGRNLWLLQVDDEHESHSGEVSPIADDDGSTIINEPQEANSNQELTVQEQADSENAEVHHCCDERLSEEIPLNSKRFKLIQSACSNFLVVSYHKPPYSGDKNPGSTFSCRKILETGPVEWAVDVPDEIMERAVAFANTLKIPHLWIRGLCTPRHMTAREDEISTQAMSLIVSRSKACVALIDSDVSDRRLIRKADELLECKSPRAFRRDLSQAVDAISELMGVVCEDPWAQQAYSLQERIYGANKLYISMKLGFALDDWRMSLLSLLSKIRGFLVLDMAKLETLVTQLLSSPRLLLRASGSDPRSISRLMRRFHKLSPTGSLEIEWTGRRWSVARMAEPRSSKLSAAFTVTNLRRSTVHDVYDFLPILTSICNYRIVLDDRSIRQTRSLAVTYMALAIMNGDFSLLIPDLYPAQCSGEDSGDSSLFPNLPAALGHIHATHLRSATSTTDEDRLPVEVTDLGLHCPATIWKADRLVDLSAVRDKWQGFWSDFWCVQIWVAKMEHESDNAWEIRRERVAEWLRHRFPIIQDKVYTFWAKKDSLIRPFLNPEKARDPERGLLIIFEIMLDILRAIEGSGLSSLANSVWRSVKRYGPTGKDKHILPDDFHEICVDPQYSLRVAELFNFDWDDFGGFQQLWIIQRVMISGSLWYGDMISPADLLNASENPRNPFVRPRESHAYSLHDSRPELDETLDDLSATRPGSDGSPKPSADINQTHPMAMFDIDEAATIAVPVNQHLEALPHPRERSMRVCWSISLQPEANLQCSVDKGDTREGDFIGADSSSALGGQFAGEVSSDPVIYQVVDKVRGCWSSSAHRNARRCIFK